MHRHIGASWTSLAAEIVNHVTQPSRKVTSRSHANVRTSIHRIEDDCENCGEVRIICFGVLAGRMVVVGYTPRGAGRHIFSMRKANEREQARIGPQFGL